MHLWLNLFKDDILWQENITYFFLRGIQKAKTLGRTIKIHQKKKKNRHL